MNRILPMLISTLLLSTPIFSQEKSSLDDLVARLQKTGEDTVRVKVLEDLTLHYIRKPGENKIDLDSAIMFAKQSETLSNKLQYSKGKGNSYRYRYYAFNERGDHLQAKQYIEKAIEVYKQQGSYGELGESYHALGTCYSTDDGAQLQTRIQAETNALEAYLQTNNSLAQAGSYRQLGELYQVAANYPQSIRNLQLSLALYQQNNYKELHGVYDLMSQHYRLTANFEESVKYGLLAIKTAEAVGDTSLQLCTLFNRLALSYFVFNDYALSKIYFLKGLAIAEKYGDVASIHIIAPNAAMAMNKLKQSKEGIQLLTRIMKTAPPKSNNAIIQFNYMFIILHLANGDVKAASPYLLDMVNKEKDGHISGLNERKIYAGCIVYYIADKEYDRALLYIQKLAHHPEVELREQINIELWKFKIDSANGKYVSAIEHYQRYKSFNDSAFSETKTRQIEHLKIAFETEKKDQAILLQEKNIRLLTNEKNLQQVILQNTRLTKNIILAGSILLLLLVVLLYSRYRIKQQSNRKLEQKQNEINVQNETLKGLVKEKEWLLKEIHHRVKNNLQIVMSLLSSQSIFLKDSAAMSAIRDSKLRVNSMSLIHQKLYMSDNVSSIDMQQYIKEMADHLKDAFNINSQIRFILDTDPLILDVSQAVPVGLILNEAITNAIKYAFPDGEGTISISLKQHPGGELLLSIRDDGKGLPPEFSNNQVRTLGMSLMRGLSEDIDGDFSIRSENGTVVIISFQKESVALNKATV